MKCAPIKEKIVCIFSSNNMELHVQPEDSQSQSSIGKKKSTQVISMLKKPFARKTESPVR